MNIFYTSKLPSECAQDLDDKRLVKMVLETAQLLSTTIHELSNDITPLRAPYKITHRNHPCAVWARESENNYTWLVNLFGELSNEYTYRFGRQHKCLEHIFTFASIIDYLDFPLREFSIPPNCTPFKEDSDTQNAYRRYMQEVKWVDGKARFTRRPPPEWSQKAHIPFVIIGRD